MWYSFLPIVVLQSHGNRLIDSGETLFIRLVDSFIILSIQFRLNIVWSRCLDGLKFVQYVFIKYKTICLYVRIVYME